MIALSINENPYVPEALVKEALYGLAVNRYPSAQYTDLKQALVRFLNTQLKGVTTLTCEQLVFGNGSDELISLCLQSLLEPGDGVVCATPCFSEYLRAAKNARLNFHGVPMSASLYPSPIELLTEAKAQRAKLLILCRPDNPSGQMLSEVDLDRLLSQFEGYVLLDEAYIEFSYSPFDTLALLASYPRLILMRTFSKAFGLAGLRLGYLLASPEIAQMVNALRHPYNVNVFAVAVAKALLDAPEESLAQIKTLIASRERLSNALRPLVAKVYPSQANFLLIQDPKAKEIYEALLEAGLQVRAFSEPSLDQCLRVSIGLEEDNERLLWVLENAVKEEKP